MKRIITIILLVICSIASSQTLSWNIADNFDNFSYSAAVCRIDSNDNIYTKYSTTLVQYGDALGYIEKYNAGGTRDTTFGTNGVLALNSLLPGSGSKYVYSFEITNDQKLLFLAKSGSLLYFLRLNTDGTLDTTLNGTGVKQILTDTNRYYEHFSPSMIKEGNNYFMSHNFDTIQNQRLAEVHCFDDSGNLVTTFANQGHFLVNYGALYTSYCSIRSIFYINNSIYISGTSYVNSTTSDRYITKLNPTTGQPDANFGTNGQLLFNDRIPSLIQADGKIIYIRSVDISPAQQDLHATRYLVDGTVDSTFANNGTMTVAAAWTSSSYVKPYNLPNGDILLHYRLTLFASDKDAVMYITNAGVKNTSFGGNVIDNGNPVLGSFGLPTYKANPGNLSLGTNYFVTTSERQALPQSITTTKVNYTFQALSTNENNQDGFKILPNPSDSEINILALEPFNTLRIYNVEGRLLQTSVTTNPILEKRLDISSLSKGVYIVEVQSENKREIQKLIKN